MKLSKDELMYMLSVIEIAVEELGKDDLSDKMIKLIDNELSEEYDFHINSFVDYHDKRRAFRSDFFENDPKEVQEILRVEDIERQFSNKGFVSLRYALMSMRSDILRCLDCYLGMYMTDWLIDFETSIADKIKSAIDRALNNVIHIYNIQSVIDFNTESDIFNIRLWFRSRKDDHILNDRELSVIPVNPDVVKGFSRYLAEEGMNQSYII